MKKNTVKATLASRAMVFTGVLLLAFIIYHILHFTGGAVHGEYFGIKDHMGRNDVYSMVVLSFRQKPIAIIYMAAMIMLGMHLYHGLASLLQTFGLILTGEYGLWQKLSLIFVVLVVGGLLSVPAAIMLNIIRLPGE